MLTSRQDLDNNGNYWNRLEIWCRGLTGKYQVPRSHQAMGNTWS